MTVFVDDVSYSWFWQPPIEGKPGLMMIKDTHPGPDHPEIRFVAEALREVIWACESSLPKDVHLPALKIYVTDPAGLWFEVQTNVVSRIFTKAEPELSEEDLNMLWHAREE